MRTVYQEQTALGSRVQLALVTDSGDAAETAAGPIDELFRTLWLEVFRFEKRCSRFLPGSELSQFNRSAGVKAAISPEFHQALLAARRMADRTDGLFNPFILPALQRAGYGHSLLAGHEADASDDHSDRSVVPADRLEISGPDVAGGCWARIPYGSALDLGGCGKGYIGDVLADMADSQAGGWLAGYWFAIGGDVITQGADEDGRPWKIYLQPDPRDDRRIGEVTAPRDGRFAVATSTTAYRRGERQGKDWHHIIDPHDGRPARSDISLATVCGPSLLEADVLASCAIITGSAGARAFLDGQGVRDALWQTAGQPGGDPHYATLGDAITTYGAR